MGAARRVLEVVFTDDESGRAVWLRTEPVGGHQLHYVAFVAAHTAAIDRDLSHYIEVDDQKHGAFDAVQSVVENVGDQLLVLCVKKSISESTKIALTFENSSEFERVAAFVKNGLQ